MSPPTRRTWLGRLARAGAWALLTSCVLAVTAYVLRNAVVAPLAIGELARRLEAEQGLSLSVERVDGDWFDDLELGGIALSSNDDGMLHSLAIERLTLEYGLLQLLSGDWAALERVDAHGIVLELDLDAPRDARESSNGATGAWPLVWPEFALLDVDVILRLPGERVIAIRDAACRGRRGAGGHELVLDAPDVALEGDYGIALARESVHAKGRFVDRAFEFDQVEFEGDIRAHSPQLRVALAPRVEIDGVLEALDGRLEFESTIGAPQYAATWRAFDLDLEALARLVAPSVALVITGRGNGAGEVNVEEGSAWSTARGRLVDACVEGWTIDEVEFDVAQHDRVFEIARLRARRAAATLSARSVSIPIGLDGFVQTVSAMRGEIEVAGFELQDASPVDLPLHELDFTGLLTEAGLALESGVLSTESGELRVQRGDIVWGPTDDTLFSQARYDIDLTAAFDDLAELGALWDDREWGGQLSGALHVSGTLSAPFGDLDLHGVDVVCSGWNIGRVAVRAGTDGRTLNVETLTIDGALGALEARGQYHFEEARFDPFIGRASIPEVAALIPELAYRGALEVEAELRGEWRAPIGTFRIDATDLALRDLPALGAVRAVGELGDARVEFSELEGRFADADWRATGSVRHNDWAAPWTIDLASMWVKREQVELELARACRIEVEGVAVRIPEFDLRGVGGNAVGSFSSEGGDGELLAMLTGLDPTPLAALFAPPTWSYGSVDGTLSVQRAEGRWSGHVDLALAALQPFPTGPSVTLGLSGGFAGQRAHLERFELRSEVGLRATLSGEFPFDDRDPLQRADGVLQAAWDISVDDLAVLPWRELGIEHDLIGTSDARGSVAGAWPDLRGWLELDAAHCTVTPRSSSGVVAALDLRDASLSARAVLDDGLTLQRFDLRAPGQIELTVEGRALTGDAVRGGLSGDQEAWRSSALELSTRWSIDDLSFLSSYWPALRRVGGSSSGSLAARGTWSSILTDGELVVQRGELRLDTQLASFEQVEARARLNGSKVTVETCKGELGAGPFEVDGEIDFESGEPVFDLRVRGRELLALQQREVRLRADVDLSLRGPASALVLAGDLKARDGRWVTNIDWYRPASRRGISTSGFAPLFSIPSGPFSSMRFDLALRGGDPFRFETNVARGAVRADLTLAGTGREPELSGALFFEKTSVFLSGTDLALQSGTLTLDRRRPLSPDLDFNLTARVRGYAIGVRIEGNYDEPVVEFSSSPPLPADDILALVLTQRAPGAAFEGDSAAVAAESVIVYLGRDLMSRLFGAESAVAERVEWQVGADVTQGGASTAQLRIRVLGPADGEGRALYLRGERDTYDRINYGVRFVLRLD